MGRIALGKSVLMRRSGRLVLSAMALAVGLLVGPLMAGHASAYIGVCDTDPTVYLSNGDKVSLGAHIYDQASDVLQVASILHVPVGTSVNNIVYDGYGYLESIAVVPDVASAGNYYSTTVVGTMTPGVQVTAWTTVGNNNTRSASGYSWQSLSVYFL
jgi:hypothetical protein